VSGFDIDRPASFAGHEIEQFESTVNRFLDREASPTAMEQWRERGSVDRTLWNRAGDAGLLGLSIPEAYGGMGADFRYEAVLIQAMGRRGAHGFCIPLHNAVVAPYLVDFATEDQKHRWLPRVVSGDTVLAVAMSEPGAGSDLQGMKTTAVRSGDHYLLNGQKTFISNGLHASLVVVAARTGQARSRDSISLFAVDVDNLPGFSRGRLLEKLGQESRDTTELFFEDARISADCLLGKEGSGFAMLMKKLPQERMVIAWQAMAMIDWALEVTLKYVKDRSVFGKRLSDLQNTQFILAECATEAKIAKVFLYHCTEQLLVGRLDAATASMAKYWITEAQGRIVDKCLQLHGGNGYMLEFEIARMYRDSRAFRIYGGTTEIMKTIIGRSLTA